jgi:glycine/D-amino acid oxidase-like deaminating enzyme/nitrite reductase/ring-hydroxylating ferredoxin subunit
MVSLGNLQSYWIASTPKTNYPTLDKDVVCDVVVIGGGIVGITTALRLRDEGLKVVLIEMGKIAQGVSGNTTAKVTSQHNLIYDYLISSFGQKKAQLYAESNQKAIDEIEKNINRFSIDADFIRVPAYIIADSQQMNKQIKKEVDAAKKLNLPASYEVKSLLPFKTFGAVKFENQARFHPRKYLLSLAKKINSRGSFIFENTKAIKIEKNVVINDKGKIKADNIVVASHVPFFKTPGLFFSRLYQYQSYGLGIYLKEEFPDEMLLTTGENDTHTFRLQETKSGMMLIGGGNGHKVGQMKNPQQIYQRLADFYLKNFKVKKIAYHWSAQDPKTPDRVPYIGKISENTYIATGFAKWGMTQSMVSAILITDLIMNRKNEWQDLYDPNRKDILNSAGSFVKEVGNTAKNLMTGKMRTEDQIEVNELENGDAKIGTINGREVGIYKDEKGNIHAVSPFCTFEGCKVRWNNEDKTWDCPCCGSRYTFDGKVINGPATVDLEKISL